MDEFHIEARVIVADHVTIWQADRVLTEAHG